MVYVLYERKGDSPRKRPATRDLIFGHFTPPKNQGDTIRISKQRKLVSVRLMQNQSRSQKWVGFIVVGDEE